jgi:chromosome segregation protein
MYLKSIDIVGYKSFPHKTHLDLEPGITGIIGPNGCGKSNIMESVRWCLGEMSWKSLRADHMIDVIFAGTSKRPPMGMTEVTLTFDNASNMLPVQFSEVTVSRRIFRSGESAYFLNKTQCRLRDIREMFLDTGVGGDGYAIIDQGGVDAMITSKPEERRAFFEEAAGVAKYKAKREEALRKLERVEMDMGRLQDSVSLIDEQVRKLDNDARKAKLYKKYKEELAAMEAAHILDQMAVVEKELAAVAAQVGPLEETFGTRRTEMNAEGANLAALNLDKANQQNQVIDSNRKISEVKSEIGRLDERLKMAGDVLVETEARVAACQAELSQAQERLTNMLPEMSRAEESVSQASAARAAALQELESWQAKVDAMASGLREAQAGLENLRRAALNAAQESLNLHRKLSAEESSWSHREQDVRRSLRELNNDISQSAACARDGAALREALRAQKESCGGARQAAESLEKELAELRQRQSSLAEQTLRLHSDLAGSKARAESLEAQGGQNPYWVGAQACLNAGIPGIIGTVRGLFKVEESAKASLEDVLGERLYAVVCEDSTAARAGVELLQAAGKGRVRFLVLSSLPERQPGERSYPEEAKSLLSCVQFDPKFDKVVRYLLEESYVLGKVLFGDHWVYGGAAQAEGLQLSLAGLDEVRAGVAALETRGAELAAEAQRCAAETSEVDARLRQAWAHANEAAAQERAMGAQLSQKEEALALCLENVDLSTQETARILAEMALSKERIHALRREIGEAAQREKETRSNEEEAASRAAAAKDELSKMQAGQELLKEKVRGSEDQLSFLAKTLERLTEEKQSLAASVSRRSQEQSDLAAKKEETCRLQDQTRQQLQVLHGELAKREQESLGVYSRLQELERSISEREAVLRKLTAEHDGVQAELHKFEVQSSSLKTRQDSLKNRLWDDWQLTAEEARERFPGQVVDQEKIETLRKRISGMGNINMAAPEEYDALLTKQQFLISQVDDLNAAKEDLKAAIQKINATTRENFRQTFIDVREHFRRLYGVLFEGGEADLVLTDPENILETGIDIVAQPPGKRLQSISLLSGGEKTLTAIALLFAFFMVKPSPFCMLDEADAALDDANVERFVSLLKEFQARSQFLIVSHNKRTMEAADVIYGVTMEELGVSQLISVDFRKKAAGEADLPGKPTSHGPFSRRAPGAPAAVAEEKTS